MKQIIIIENDSSESRIGFAGEKEPRFIFPTLFGSAKLRFPPATKSFYNPDEALQHKKDCGIDYPIKNGIIENWVSMERIWRFSFEEKLKIDPTNHPVLLIIPPNNSKKRREKIAEILFETFEVPALCIKDQSILIEIAHKSSAKENLNDAWLGGSLFASSNTFLNEFIRIEDYWEKGPELIIP